MEIATNLVRADIEHNKFIHEATSYEDEQITVKKLFDMFLGIVDYVDELMIERFKQFLVACFVVTYQDTGRHILI